MPRFRRARLAPNAMSCDAVAAVLLLPDVDVPDVEGARRFLLDAVMLDAGARCDVDVADCIGEAFAGCHADEMLDQDAAAVGACAHHDARVAHQLSRAVAPLVDDVDRLIGRRICGELDHHAVLEKRQVEVFERTGAGARRLREERRHRRGIVPGPLLERKQRDPRLLRADRRQRGHPMSVDEHDASAGIADPLMLVRADRKRGTGCGRERARFQPAQVRVLPLFLSLRRESCRREALQGGAAQFN